jgi:hypothetical protein
LVWPKTRSIIGWRLRYEGGFAKDAAAADEEASNYRRLLAPAIRKAILEIG